MHWLLQAFEDTAKLARALDHLGLPYSWHKVVPFVGDLLPEPDIAPKDPVILFGSYTLWRYAARRGLKPGVFKIRPFLFEVPWQSAMLNGPGALVQSLVDLPQHLPEDDRLWFVRPVDDSKEIAGKVLPASEILHLARQVASLDPEDLPKGSLRPDTLMMLTPPARIAPEWRIWVVGDQVVTWSLYKEGRRVTYRHEIEDDALTFAQTLVAQNPGYAPAYVLDICRSDQGLRLLETNCLNAAGFYAADLIALVQALETQNRALTSPA